MHDGVATQFVHSNGAQVRPGICIKPDHYETQFTVRVRALQPVTPDQLTQLIQSKYEVVSMARTAQRCVVCNVPSPSPTVQ